MLKRCLLLLFSLLSAFSVERAGAHETALAALARLKRGNERFSERAHDEDHSTLRTFVDGQRPHTVVLSCSDSRVPVELVFDQRMGDMVRPARRAP